MKTEIKCRFCSELPCFQFNNLYNNTNCIDLFEESKFFFIKLTNAKSIVYVLRPIIIYLECRFSVHYLLIQGVW